MSLRRRPVPAARLLPLALLAGACHVHGHAWHDGPWVDGHRLDEHHTEVLALDGWGARGLELDLDVACVRVTRTDGPTRLHVVLLETVEGDASARFVDGRLELETASGAPAAVGDVRIETADALARLSVRTGTGDVQVVGVPVAGDLVVSTGLGAIEVRGVGDPTAVDLSTGMGTIELAGLTSPRIHASSGMGAVHCDRVAAGHAVLTTGMGDVELADCDFDALEASSGVGDVTARATRWERGDLESGLGRVRRR